MTRRRGGVRNSYLDNIIDFIKHRYKKEDFKVQMPINLVVVGLRMSPLATFA